MKSAPTLIFILWFAAPLSSLAKDNDSPIHDMNNMVGFSLGTPSVVNLEVGTVWNAVNLRASGMYTRNYSGIQIGFVPFVQKGRNRSWDVALITGHFRWLDSDYQDKYGVERFDEWNYFGLETMLKWKIFFVAPGVSIGKGNWESPLILLRLGSLYSF